MKKTVLSLAVGLLMAPAFAETSEVESEGSGFLTSALNSAVESSMAAPASATRKPASGTAHTPLVPPSPAAHQGTSRLQRSKLKTYARSFPPLM